MIYDNGKEIRDWTSIDNEVLEKIYRIEDLSKLTKDVLVSLCRQIFHQDGDNVMSTSGWAAANVTAKQVGCSERGVRRAYDELVERNIISKEKRLREKNINGNPVPRKVNWITRLVLLPVWLRITELQAYLFMALRENEMNMTGTETDIRSWGD